MPDKVDLVTALTCGRSTCPCEKAKKGRGNVHCPAHDDQRPSLSVNEKAGKVLVKCHAGCSQDAVIEALRKRGLWPAPSHGGSMGRVLTLNGQRGDRVTKSQALPAQGLTVAALAMAKRFEICHLKAWGVSDRRQNGAPRVVVPYLGPEGETLSVRYRLSLTGPQRFAWRRGDHVALYGLNELEAIRKAGWVLMVEGETDTWTGGLYNIPTLGIPGKATWQPQWAAYLDGLEVFLWCEPEADDMVLRVAKDVPALKVVYAPKGTKDINEAHLQGVDVQAMMKCLKEAAVPAQQIVREVQDMEIAGLRDRADKLLTHNDPLELLKQAIVGSCYGGDPTNPMITYLAMTSRVLDFRRGGMLVHLILLGPASAGKSYAVNTSLRLLPESAYVVIDAGSPRALIYSDDDLRHKVVFFGEADSLPSSEDNPAASAVRNLLQDGHLHYDVTVRDKETGEYAVRKIRKDGPTVLCTTAVRPLGAQLMSRLFTLDVAGDREQIRAALKAQALAEVDGIEDVDDALVAFQTYLQALAPWNVVVPFAEALAEAVGQSNDAPRVLRDFQRLLSLIKSVAVIRHRYRTSDRQGRLVADIADYEAVRELVGNMYQSSVTGVTDGVTGVVSKVAEIKAVSPNTTVTYSYLAREMSIHRDLARRRVRTALHNGWLTNSEYRRNHQADLAVGDPLPDRVGLPAPEAICHLVTLITDGNVDTSSDRGAV